MCQETHVNAFTLSLRQASTADSRMLGNLYSYCMRHVVRAGCTYVRETEKEKERKKENCSLRHYNG